MTDSNLYIVVNNMEIMKKSITTLVGSALLAGSLLFSPLQGFSGEDITNHPDYAEFKGQVSSLSKRLGKRMDFNIRKEGCLVIYKFNFYEKGDSKKYAKEFQISEFGLIKENSLEFITVPSKQIGYLAGRSKSEWNELIRDLTTYLKSPEKKEYRGMIREGDRNNEVLYLEKDELIERVKKSR
jgi:hypothetical protein